MCLFGCELVVGVLWVCVWGDLVKVWLMCGIWLYRYVKMCEFMFIEYVCCGGRFGRYVEGF